MKPEPLNPYTASHEPLLRPKEFQAANPVPLGIRLAGLLFPTVSSAIGTWVVAFGFVVAFAKVGPITPNTLTLTGNIVALAWGAFVGFAVGLTVAQGMTTVLREHKLISILLGAIFAPCLALAVLLLASELYLVPVQVLIQ